MKQELDGFLSQNFDPNAVIAVDVYLESRKTRAYVGRLQKIGRNKQSSEKNVPSQLAFVFTYDTTYLYHDSSIPLGPDLPLTKKEYKSNELFPAFADRIPSRGNPAFKEYCAKFNISPKETDPIVLLPTIARRGPSSFLFEPVMRESFASSEVRKYRQELGLTVRDFAIGFDFSPATIQKIESQKSTGRDVLKRIEIYRNFPDVAMFEIRRNAARLHGNTLETLVERLKSFSKQDRKK